jgi:alkanesulfonate monooxygenase SsuD/methylene tetrahydromethanopterin reductase-like flavin-dependent oxidoreductase (luciferase family)
VRYGVGAGWLREEAEAMGMPWDRRGRRSEEHIALLRALWCAEGDLVEFHGEFHDIPPVDPEPRPVQRPIPIFVGGHSDAALERAGRIGDGWISAPMSPGRLREHWSKVQAAAERHGRDPDALRLVSAMSPLADASAQPDAVGAYREAGVHHLIVDLYVSSRDAVFDELHRLGSEVLPELR